MTDIFDDPRLRRAEDLTFQAEQKERSQALFEARQCYAEAALLDEAVVFEVPTELPRTRSVLAVGAISLHARAGNYDRAVCLAERLLGAPLALTQDGLEEIRILLSEHKKTLKSQESSTTSPHFSEGGRTFATALPSAKEDSKIVPHQNHEVRLKCLRRNLVTLLSNQMHNKLPETLDECFSILSKLSIPVEYVKEIASIKRLDLIPAAFQMASFIPKTLNHLQSEGVSYGQKVG